jgi:hypothetical protein
MVSSIAQPCSLEYRASLSIFMMLSLTCGVLRVLVFHPSCCEVTVVRFDAVVCARFGMVEMVGIC